MILVLAFFVATTLGFNLLFVLVIVINTVIGIYQEVKIEKYFRKT